MAFRDTAHRIFALHSEGRYEDALSVIEGAKSSFPEYDNDLTFLTACVLARSGRSDEAMANLLAGLKRGQWWTPVQLDDFDLDPIRELAGWESLAQACAAITADKLQSRPRPIIRNVDNPLGTLLVVQGARASQLEIAEIWDQTAPPRWNVVTPCGGQPTYMEQDWQWLRSAEENVELIQSDIADLSLKSPIVLNGFSIGSEIACHFIEASRFEIAGLIVVAAWSQSDFAELRRTAKDRSIESLIICGADDPRREKYLKLQADLLGLDNVRFELIEGMGHDNPENLPELVSDFLATIR